MKKEVYGIMTDVPIMLKSITIKRRSKRMRNADVWMIDGMTTDDKEAACVGYVTVIYRGRPDNHCICGSIRDFYDMAISESNMLWDELYRELHVNLKIEDADIFFTWRSGTVDQSWQKPAMFSDLLSDDVDPEKLEGSTLSDTQTPSPAPEWPLESREP